MYVDEVKEVKKQTEKRIREMEGIVAQASQPGQDISGWHLFDRGHHKGSSCYSFIDSASDPETCVNGDSLCPAVVSAAWK